MATRASFEDSHVPHLDQRSSSPSTSAEADGSHSKYERNTAQPDDKHAPRANGELEGEVGTNHLNADGFWEPAAGVVQDDGVTKIESLYLVFGKGWGLFALWFSIGMISYAYALSQSTTWHCEWFSTSLLPLLQGVSSNFRHPLRYLCFRCALACWSNRCHHPDHEWCGPAIHR
jgi:hypothetical protein